MRFTSCSFIVILLLAGCGGGPGPTGDPVPFEELSVELADVACSTYLTCDLAFALPAQFTGDRCAQYFESLYDNTILPPVADAIERGTIVYDPAAAAECIAGYDDIGCDFAAIGVDPTFAQTCARMFVGQIADGASCRIDQECAFASHCGGIECPGICTPRIPAGGACAELSSCEVGYYCREQICQTLFPPPGDGTCEDGTFFDCPLDEACIGATATTPGQCTPIAELRTRAAGESCSTNAEDGELCETGLSCAEVASPGTRECRVPVAANGPCFSATPSMCPSSQRCDANPAAGMYEGTCVDYAGEGDPCTTGTPCDVGLTCSMGMCVAIRDNGEACTSTNECYSNRCEAGVCAAPDSCGM